MLTVVEVASTLEVAVPVAVPVPKITMGAALAELFFAPPAIRAVDWATTDGSL